MTDGLRKWIEKIARYLIPFLVSAGMVVWLFHKVDIHEMMRVIREGCDFRWIVVMMLITALSHVIRGIRWGIQLRAVGVPRMSVVAESVAIFGAYALNLVFSGVGEAWRCVYVSRRENTPLSTVVGTDLGDRSSDAVVVLMLLGLALVVAKGPIDTFISHYAIGEDIRHFSDDPRLWCAVILGLTLVWASLYFFRKYRYIEKIDSSLKNVWQGFKVLFTMKGVGAYVVLTLGIWLCYFMETYVCFYAFPFTRALIDSPGSAYGLIPGLVVFVFGSFSMAVPSNGGLGPWNIAVMFALSIYGIGNTEGAAFSMVMWSFQAAMLVMLGVFSAIYIAATKRKIGSSR
ncbi:flippase-like domain-containing protein [Barnesiella sp. WM24]|uniref:lysylphosphatidylglycerol synthase transmembrane domain-containing protein n=1 Tax=Barnesiella sp. WM24 TaxID=2558278 RepID=UPI0010719063|nr:lysylphosphatidylglycerol synthase transmembrane domain-containing protein [Barnesiella sp. WM24]TFU94135.1 flippase-like domain-containing protein [Barnesiella sp. WM24]